MSIIYCTYDMFSLNQPIRVIEENGNTLTFYASNETLSDKIAELCSAKNIEQVKLYGNSSYLFAIKDEIEHKYELTYSNHKINVEVN